MLVREYFILKVSLDRISESIKEIQEGENEEIEGEGQIGCSVNKSPASGQIDVQNEKEKII